MVEASSSLALVCCWVEYLISRAAVVVSLMRLRMACNSSATRAANLLVARVADELQAILSLIKETTTAAREIKYSTQQQTSASEELASTIVEVRDVAAQVAASAQETTQAIVELTTLAERLRDMMEEELQEKGKAKTQAGARMME